MGRPRQSGYDLPPRVYFRHGAFYYVSPNTGRWIRLGDRVDTAVAKLPEMVTEVIAAKKRQKRFRAHVRAWATAAVDRAHRRSRRKGTPCDLTVESVLDLYAQHDGRCALTGLPFDNEFGQKKFRTRPWMPSIDRIDSKGPYLLANCRIICHAVNLALNEYGLPILLEVARGLTRAKVLDTRQSFGESEPKSITDS